MTEKHLLITGRPASGKTELLIAYANMHSKTTLFLSEEMTEVDLKQRELNADVKVIDSQQLRNVNLEDYHTLCIDYLELLSDDTLQELIKIIKANRVRVIITSQVRRGTNELMLRIRSMIKVF